MSEPRPLRVALAQWPPLALAWSIHGALLFYLFVTYVPADQVPPAHRAAIGLALLLLVVAEIGLLVALNVVVEWITAPLGPKNPVDLAKALLVAAGVGFLSASILKFDATSVHLRRTDLWFAWTNFRQLLQEATPMDAAGLLLMPSGVLLLAMGLFFGLRRFRRRSEGAASGGALPRAVLLPVVATVGAGLLYASSPAVRLFGNGFVPEVHWGREALAGSYLPLSDPPEGGAAAVSEPPIVPYRPDPSGARRHNVVLVMLESIPWGRTSFAGGPSGATPNLEALAAESVLFSRAYTTSTHSDYAQMAILSSLHPRKYERHDYYGRIEYPRTLIWDALRPAGYRTMMFSCQNERWGNMLNFLDTPGLEVLRHSLNWPRARHRGSGTESKVYEETPVEEWKAWRRAHGEEPFLAYFNFQANHFPYEAPPEAPRPFRPFELDFPASFLRYPRDKVPVMLNRFYNALHYSDAWIGEIVDFLRRRGEWERTVMIVVSDHGEAFYEHEMPTHGTSVLEEQVRSLWLMRIPGEAARTVDEAVSLLDLAPTLLEVLGLPPHGNFQGRSDLLDPSYSSRGRPFFFTIQGLTFEDAVLLDGWKYLINWERRFRLLFDLRSDPGETRDFSGERGDRVLELDERLRAFLTTQLAYYRERRWEAGVYPPPLP